LMKKANGSKIPFAAHIIHLGLILLILGHVSTTVLVERGNTSHRITLVKDDIVAQGAYGYEFTSLTLTDDALEVGDGFVGIQINVYQRDDAGNWDKIGEVEPGMLRFDNQNIPRSEVDTLSRWTGDLVFIFDGSQAANLMQNVQTSSVDNISLVRVTVYDLPHSHFVWVGWVFMLMGSATITGVSLKTKSLNHKMTSQLTTEEE